MSTKKIMIQICDGPDGCGRVIQDVYECPQRCSWNRHDQQPKYKDQPVENAPLMRKALVCEVER